ncbi:MAG TPA: ComEC/Rec2 family competence protein [Steroidobacteraceae bacterium]|nr:ComEC/Rec2 family competence protein [Steroidobacteraceae bacterium]
MNSVAAGLLAGILLALAMPMGWQSIAGCTLLALALVAVIGGRWVLALAALAGFLLAHVAASRVLNAAYDCGERRLVVARIDSIPVAQGAGWQYDALVEPVSPPRPALMRVRISHAGAQAPRSGERWQLLLQFDTPAAGAVADARRRVLLRDHVSATARVRGSPLNLRLASAGASIDGLRLAVAGRIQARVHDPSAAALLAALAVGVTGDVSALQWRVFSATGITHLVAISGMHVTFFALLCMAMARMCWRRWSWLAARCRRESFAAAVGVVLAFAYALLSGFSVPAQRTALMLTVFLLARGCGRQVAPLWSVAASLVAVLLLDPLAVLSAGFWLSFCAVASIILIAGGRLHPPGALRAAALVQWVVTLALLPVTAALFGTVSAAGPLVNAAAIPLFTFALVPPVLVATALYVVPLGAAHWCADHLVDVAAWAAGLAWPWLVRAAQLPGALLSADVSWPWLLLAVPSVVLALAPLPVSMRLGALALLCCGLLARPARPEAGSLDVVMFDVGASRAVLLRTFNHQLLLGTGEGFGTGGRRFERDVLPELHRSRGGALDIVLDRADRDSLQALSMARARLPLRQAIAGSARPAPELLPCADGQWHWDGVRFIRRATRDGCWVGVHVGGQLLLVPPVRMPSGEIPETGAAALLVMPRRARDAALLAGHAAPQALALASLTASEWRSGGWREVRRQHGAGGLSLWSTANEGTLRLSLKADGRIVRTAAAAWRPGIWSGGDSRSCREP